MAALIDTPFGQIDPDNPPSPEEMGTMAQWAGQQITVDFAEHLSSFMTARVVPYANFVAKEFGASPAPLWRAMADLRVAADRLDKGAADRDAGR